MAKTRAAIAAGLIALITSLPPPPVPAQAATLPHFWLHPPPARAPLTSRHRAPHHEKSLLYLLTAYCSCRICCGKTDGITASGRRARAGRTAAVDPGLIPLGTRLFIQGLGERVAEDTGGVIRGRHLDIFFLTHAQAISFGRQWRRVELLPVPANPR